MLQTSVHRWLNKIKPFLTDIPLGLQRGSLWPGTEGLCCAGPYLSPFHGESRVKQSRENVLNSNPHLSTAEKQAYLQDSSTCKCWCCCSVREIELKVTCFVGERFFVRGCRWSHDHVNFGEHFLLQLSQKPSEVGIKDTAHSMCLKHRHYQHSILFYSFGHSGFGSWVEIWSLLRRKYAIFHRRKWSGAVNPSNTLRE